MLDLFKLQRILDHLPRLTIAVVGDFFLDKYLDIDGRLTEKSIETGLDAYQVTVVRTSPGAAGTVTNNLAALGVGRIVALTVIGADGEGFELKRELARRRVDLSHIIDSTDRHTPTYTKPMLNDHTGPACELNRLDIKNRSRMPEPLVREIAHRLDQLAAQSDAVIVADQVSEPDCGVVTEAIRQRLAELADRHRKTILFADSRERIGEFRRVITKPNCGECLRAVGRVVEGANRAAIEDAARKLARQSERPVFCTVGEEGTLVATDDRVEHVPAIRVTGPVDIVGAGDSATAGIVCALCSGAEPVEAAALGNLVASITIGQLGTTGTATPEQVLERFRSVSG